ncbi:MAG: GIY-YIG nuclease family protein [Eggerthellaceae bacterium]|jgi:predicted GIY-YIG superfamily endonuclease
MAFVGSDRISSSAVLQEDSAGYFMYVVTCSDGSLYTGYTRDVERRVAQHNDGTGAKYTRAHGPVTLRAQARFATQHEALSAEYRFKRLARADKLALIARAEECRRTDSLSAEQAFARVLSEAFGLSEDTG